MGDPELTNQTLNVTLQISDVKNRLSDLVNAVARYKTRVLIEKRGTPVAALVSTDDLERLKRLDAEREETTRALERISEAFDDVPLEELEAKIDAIIAEGGAQESEARFAVIDRMRAVFADIPDEEIEREAERTVAAARERHRHQAPEFDARSA